MWRRPRPLGLEGNVGRVRLTIDSGLWVYVAGPGSDRISVQIAAGPASLHLQLTARDVRQVVDLLRGALDAADPPV